MVVLLEELVGETIKYGLEGAVALVTGAAPADGLGHGIGRALLDGGAASVLFTDGDEVRGQETRQVTERDAMSDIPAVLRVLKAMLRTRGLHYADLAAALGKSESSLKRYLSGSRLTLSLLEDICRAIGMGLGEFYEIAARELSAKPETLTPEQEEALAADAELMLVMVLLLQGHSSTDIATDMGIDDAELFPLLMRLERLGLIKVFPGNRARLTIGPVLDVSPGSPIREGFNHVMKRELLDQDFSDRNTRWSVGMVKLSPASVAMLQPAIEEFHTRIRALADRDRRAGTDRHWCSVFACAKEINLAEYARSLRRLREDAGM